jgi:hypothetical protein
MGLRLQRSFGQRESLSDGMWCRNYGHTDPATAWISCPICAHEIEVEVHRDTPTDRAEPHRIDRAGKITPAVVCPKCPFFDWVTLEGWE